VLITAVPGMRIVTPFTAKGDVSVCECAPGTEKIVVASLPVPAHVMGGSTLYLPDPLQVNVSLSALSARARRCRDSVRSGVRVQSTWAG
jgi:hypothetical protein